MSTELSKSKNPYNDWDINKNYFSPSGERVVIYVDGKWTQFERHDAISNLFNEQIKQEAIGFAEFCAGYTAIRGDKRWMMHNSPFTKYTTEELYNLYLNK